MKNYLRLSKVAERCRKVKDQRREMLWQPLDTKSNDHTMSKSLKADIVIRRECGQTLGRVRVRTVVNY